MRLLQLKVLATAIALGVSQAVAVTPATSSQAPLVSLAATQWETVGAEYGIDPILLYAIALAESRTRWSDASMRPSPYVVVINGKPVWSATEEEARAVFTAALTRGDKIQDVGMMQIHLPSHPKAVDDPITLLDPAVNLRVGARILREALDSTDDVVLGVGRYHSWTPHRARAYGAWVLAIHRRLHGLEG